MKKSKTRGQTTPERDLSDLERQVMQIVWSLGRVTAKDVKDALERTHPLALTTVLTILTRLKGKKYVREVPSLKRSKVFNAVVPRKAVAGRTLKKVLRQFFGDSPSELIAHLIKHEKVDAEEMREIRNLLDQHASSRTIKKGGNDHV